eukprot:scaffold90685_cov69-Phaeocystis_antarctica.AAC.9
MTRGSISASVPSPPSLRRRPTLKRDTSAVRTLPTCTDWPQTPRAKERSLAVSHPRFLYLPPALSSYAAGRARSRQSNSGRGGKRTLRTASSGGRAWRRERL